MKELAYTVIEVPFNFFCFFFKRIDIPVDYADNIKIDELTGTISEWRYSKGRYEYLKRWIEKSAE